MKGQLNSFLQIIIGLMVGLVIVGGIFYFGKDTISKLLKPTPPQSSKNTTVSQSDKITELVQKTTTARKEVDVEKDTTDWRTYQNQKLNISIKYPHNVTHVSENIKTGQASFAFSNTCKGEVCEGIYINAVDVPAGTDLKTALAQGKQGANSTAKTDSTYQDITINGIQGVETFRAAPSDQGLDSNGAYFIKDNRLYTFDIYFAQDKDKNIKNFNLMLKTFKILQ